MCIANKHYINIINNIYVYIIYVIFIYIIKIVAGRSICKASNHAKHSSNCHSVWTVQKRATWSTLWAEDWQEEIYFNAIHIVKESAFFSVQHDHGRCYFPFRSSSINATNTALTSRTTWNLKQIHVWDCAILFIYSLLRPKYTNYQSKSHCFVFIDRFYFPKCSEETAKK